jgi:valyl-tRNA synthetase
MAFDSTYHPEEVERAWRERWESTRAFHAPETADAAPFSIVIPPPNVTGVLHIGHALNSTLQDILVRWRRMQGRSVLWVPGTDHAGIATQNVVEKQLAAQGTDRHAIGREEFVRRVWQWKEESGGKIINQLRRLGCSCDWERERFTLDEGLSRAVRQVFVSLHDEGLIYRAERITNWCPRCHTALSDLEVENESTPGHLFHIRYPLAEGAGEGGIVVATTRPETILGDTAVAVHPDDERYRGLIGKELLVPVGPARRIPVIADTAVDPAFGTGALKITPAHDANDYETGKRHGLAAPKIMDDSARLTGAVGRYAGLERFAARKEILADLEALGLLVRREEYAVPLGHCYRCHSVVEPALSPQWFVSVKPLAEPAMAAVREKRTRIVPENWERTYFEWMENIRDWCISRQIWWGHQIPAWYCRDCNGQRVRETPPAAGAAGACAESTLRIAVDATPIVALEPPERCPSCGGGNLVRDPDVLDTWFSSALWPFSTLGWPEHTPLLASYYPTAVLVTSFDILFFWVARMMMMGLKFMGDVPFRDVYIHALVRDAEGNKMSKSRGNVIDPLGMMERYGTDACRFTLTALAAQGRDIKLAEERIAGYRNFVTKLWNASRLVAMNLEGHADPAEPQTPLAAIEDRWILSRLDGLVAKVNRSFEDYLYNEAASALYQFTWHEFCDWYLEMVKPRLGAADASGAAARATAVFVLRRVLALLHPIMPFVTEEIADRLPGGGRPLAISPFPAPDQRWVDEGAESEMALVIEIVSAVRNIRGEMNIKPSLAVEVVLDDVPAAAAAMVSREAAIVRRLANAREIRINAHAEPGESATAALSCGVLRVPLLGVVDFAAELRRLDKDIAKVDADAAFIEKKLGREDFVRNAPAEVVAKDRRRLEELLEKRALLTASRERVAGIVGGRGGA